MELFGFYLVRKIALCTLIWWTVDTTCTLPSVMQSKTFQMHYIRSPSASSSRATHGRTMTTFTNADVDGIAVTVHGEPIDKWICLFKDNDKYVLKSTDPVDIGGSDYYVYFGFQFLDSCVIYNNSDYCFIKPLCDQYSSASDEQIKVISESSGDPTTISEIQGSSVPDAYYMLLPSGGLPVLKKSLESLKTVYDLYQKISGSRSNDTELTQSGSSQGSLIAIIVYACLEWCLIVLICVDIFLRCKVYRQNKIQNTVHQNESPKQISDHHLTEKVELKYI